MEAQAIAGRDYAVHTKGERMNTLVSGYTENRGMLLQAREGDKPADRKGTSGNFARTVLAQGARDAGTLGVMSPGEMTMEEYKQYISQQIRKFPIHPSRWQENISVVIFEEGYVAMKNDPEYEAWVLNNLQAFYGQPGSCFGNSDRVYTNVYIGASKEECYAETWSVPGRSPGERAEERRREDRIRLAKRLKKKHQQKELRELAFQRQERQRMLVKKLIEHRREIEKENRQRWKNTEVKDKPDGSRVLEITTRQRNYEKVVERDIVRVEEVLWRMQMQREMQRSKVFFDFFPYCDMPVSMDGSGGAAGTLYAKL